MATVLITGCSSGIGRAAALAFARRGDRVYATVRSATDSEDLRATAASEQLELQTPTLDVTQPDTFKDLITTVTSDAGCLDVLINNAGVLIPGAFEDISEAQLRTVMETNFFGPMLLTRAVLPHMRPRQKGLIIMISSLSGLAGLAGDVAYSASKFALEGATEALRQEIDRWGIRLALVESGRYATRLDRSKGQLPPEYPQASPYRSLIETKLGDFAQSAEQAMNPADMGELLLRIADADTRQLRWPSDPLAVAVLNKLHGLDDTARAAFLDEVSDIAWWRDGFEHTPADSVRLET
ncbi:MAG: SDR family oxidoreductase [Pseudomonadota bacterium]